MLYRKGTGYGQGFQGTAWEPVQGAMKQVMASRNSVGYVNQARGPSAAARQARGTSTAARQLITMKQLMALKIISTVSFQS